MQHVSENNAIYVHQSKDQCRESCQFISSNLVGNTADDAGYFKLTHSNGKYKHTCRIYTIQLKESRTKSYDESIYRNRLRD